MKRIGVLSDTHGKLREEVVEVLKGCDVILHAGDINTQRVMERLQEIAPLCIVRGNADKDWAEGLPEKLSEEICGLRVFMVHNKKHMPKEMGNYDLAVYGHSHKYEERREGNCLYLNPGSCGPRRFSQPVTMAVVEVEEETGDIRVIRKDIVQAAQVSVDEKGGQAAFEKEEGVGAGRLAETVFSEDRLRLILRDIDKGKGVSDIAVKYGISKEMTEQICRLYLTHPGIDAVGVREKMGMPRNR
ncbi:MAG: YfcE family phosphodiesterase [Lachnospiraceae bacterium]|nr:YfcE family phosphodiesterase [Lachnospiraceae bacterium]